MHAFIKMHKISIIFKFVIVNRKKQSEVKKFKLMHVGQKINTIFEFQIIKKSLNK